MNITRKIAKNDTTNKMTIAFDVSSKKIDYYSEVKGKVSGTSCHEVIEIQDTIKNSTQAIKKTLTTLKSYAKKEGYSGLHIICEPTGSYSANLMRISHQLEHSTAYISGESVFKAKVIENNDNSKDDTKDPRILLSCIKSYTYIFGNLFHATFL